MSPSVLIPEDNLLLCNSCDALRMKVCLALLKLLPLASMTWEEKKEKAPWLSRAFHLGWDSSLQHLLFLHHLGSPWGAWFPLCNCIG